MITSIPTKIDIIIANWMAIEGYIKRCLSFKTINSLWKNGRYVNSLTLHPKNEVTSTIIVYNSNLIN